MISIKSCTESPIFVVIHGPVNHPLPTIGALSVNNKWVRYAVILKKWPQKWWQQATSMPHNTPAVRYWYIVLAGTKTGRVVSKQCLAHASQKCPIPLGFWTPSNIWFIRQSKSLPPNQLTIGSAIFAGLTSVPNTLTHRSDICHNRLHLSQHVQCGLKIH